MSKTEDKTDTAKSEEAPSSAVNTFLVMTGCANDGTMLGFSSCTYDALVIIMMTKRMMMLSDKLSGIM